MADRSGYIGRAPGDSAVIIAQQTYEPTGVQTNFTFSSGYTVGYMDVYFNGVKLIGGGTDYSASDGSTVGLTTYADNGDVLQLIAYKAFNVADVTSSLNNFTVGSVPSITLYGGSGIVSATSFSGDGSSLSGVGVAGVSTTGHSIFNTISASGITTLSATTDSTSTSTGALIVSGGVGIGKSLFVGGEISVAGTITYNDVTNVDSVGIVTAGKGLRATTGGLIVTAGVSTFGADLVGKDGVQGIIVGTGLSVAGVVTATTFSGNLTGNPTLGTGVTVYATGIVSATSYYGDGSTLTNAGITAGKAMGLAAFLL